MTGASEDRAGRRSVTEEDFDGRPQTRYGITFPKPGERYPLGDAYRRLEMQLEEKHGAAVAEFERS